MVDRLTQSMVDLLCSLAEHGRADDMALAVRGFDRRTAVGLADEGLIGYVRREWKLTAEGRRVYRELKGRLS